ncbi:uncharacterized protein LOC132313380 [Cornus florida]|uniref:uncharacterized protein LOC132313380 n=1 Tax=Cornus florida TaxID=4283 RepID=UPI00289825E6|nr:uncharacterized protein LOC132313380 [Cornus florida]
MRTADKNFPARGFSTPPPSWKSKRTSPMMPASEKKPQAKGDLFHVIHKVPAGDSPYVRAKHVQLIEKDPSRAISLFWAAINSGDRVDSALKDMAVVMKQLDRSDEAIEAIKSFRHLCPHETQESLDNVLVELFKRSGRIEEQIEMLQLKLKHIEEGIAFGGKRTKAARSQGKKIHVTIEQEYSRLLGNLAWAYLQQNDYKSAEELYRKALSLEADKNKQCNLAICLMHMNRMTEAKFLLQTIRASSEDGQMDESYAKSYERAFQIFTELESHSSVKPVAGEGESHKEIRSLPTSLICSDNGISKIAPYGSRNGSQSSPKTSFADKLKGCHVRNQYERRMADFGSRSKDNRINMNGREVGSTGKNVFTSPLPARGIPKVPFTQPRCSWSFSNGDQRSALVGDDPVGGCNRKLSFEQSTTTENVELLANQNLDRQLPGSTNGRTKAVLQNKRSTSQDWRKRAWGTRAEVNNESVLWPTVIGNSKMNSWETGGQKKLATKESNSPMESAVDVKYMRAMEASSDGDWDRSSKITVAGNVGLKETVESFAEYMNSTQEPQSLSQPTERNLANPQEFSECKSKKSWADMVEEDEQELLVGNSDFPENTWAFHTPSKCSDDWNCGEEFNDENSNSNIISQSYYPLDQIENLSQKIESFNLKDGYYSQPQNDASSRNQTARRSLCFDQNKKPDRADSFCSSPLTKKTLNFQGHDSLLSNERECTLGSGIRLMRRNRLQVFREITPESPRP